MSDQVIEEIDLEEMFRTGRGCFVLRARGDSMNGDYILDGDFVVIERRDKCRNGEQAVCLLDTGEATLCRWYQEPGGKVRLQKANPNYEPRILPAESVKVQGVVIGVLRSYAR